MADLTGRDPQLPRAPDHLRIQRRVDFLPAIVVRWVIRHMDPEALKGVQVTEENIKYASVVAMTHLKEALPDVEPNVGLVYEDQVPTDLCRVARLMSPEAFQEFLLYNASYDDRHSAIDARLADKIVDGFAGHYIYYSYYDPLTFVDSMRFLSDFLRSKGFDCEARIKAFVDGYPQWLIEYRAKYDPLYGEYDRL